MRPDRDHRETSREEDFRDFEQRDVEDGWPYADEAETAAGKARINRADGERAAESDSGFRVVDAGFEGEQPPLSSPVLPETDHREDSDQLEADILEALETSGAFLATLDLHADGHVVTLKGSVDTPEERHKVEQIVLGIKGVRRVVNHIETAGVDSHIPDED